MPQKEGKNRFVNFQFTRTNESAFFAFLHLERDSAGAAGKVRRLTSVRTLIYRELPPTTIYYVGGARVARYMRNMRTSRGKHKLRTILREMQNTKKPEITHRITGACVEFRNEWKKAEASRRHIQKADNEHKTNRCHKYHKQVQMSNKR